HMSCAHEHAFSAHEYAYTARRKLICAHEHSYTAREHNDARVNVNMREYSNTCAGNYSCRAGKAKDARLYEMMRGHMICAHEHAFSAHEYAYTARRKLICPHGHSCPAREHNDARVNLNMREYSNICAGNYSGRAGKQKDARLYEMMRGHMICAHEHAFSAHEHAYTARRRLICAHEHSYTARER